MQSSGGYPLQSLYFAYGSNLSLAQMSNRCPNSTFVGSGRLSQYRFQINNRGYANVVYTGCSEDKVEGLLYRLEPEDEERLDVCEGVPWDYQKADLEVEVWPGSVYLLARKVVEIVENHLLELNSGLMESHWRDGELGESLHDLACEHKLAKFQPHSESTIAEAPSSSSEEPSIPIDQHLAHRQPSKEDPQSEVSELATAKYIATTCLCNPRRPPGERTIALVYLSREHIQDALPREEYVERMNQGIKNGLQLGISKSYVDSVMRPYIPEWISDRSAQLMAEDTVLELITVRNSKHSMIVGVRERWTTL